MLSSQSGHFIDAGFTNMFTNLLECTPYCHKYYPVIQIIECKCEIMGRCLEFFGPVIGCCQCNKFSCQVSSLLNIQKSIVSFSLNKVDEILEQQHCKQMLRHIVRLGCQLPEALIATNLKKTCYDLQI